MERQINIKNQEKGASVSARIPTPLKKLIAKIVGMDTHINESDFIRDAIREKIMRDAPHLYRELFITQGGGNIG